MAAPEMLEIGFNARLFPSNWRPVLDEIHFGAANGFVALQFPGKAEGLAAEHLGAEISVVRRALDAAGIVAVMEIVMGVDERGYSAAGHTPHEVITANLPAIAGLHCRCVHFHFVQSAQVLPAQLPALENCLLASLDVAAGIGQEWGFQMGLEHNERDVGLFASPQACANILSLVPQLNFVWDINHVHPDDQQGFHDLLPRASMLHISDTRQPVTNEHLPLGMGTVDFVHACATLRAANFAGPAILEIGGHPKSGGFGHDSDSALIGSRQRLMAAAKLGT